MFLIIPFFAIPAMIGTAVSIIVPVAGVVGGLIVAPAVLKASGNAVDLIKDGKVGLEAQKIIKKISDYDEQIGTLVIEKGLEFENEMFTKEINSIKENMKKIEEKKKELEELKNKQ